jgi:hypothetical protein
MHTDYATPKCCPHLTTALGRTFAFGSEGGKVRCPVPPCRLSASRQGTDVYPGNAAGPLWERSEGGETPAFLRLGTQGTHLGPTPLYIGSSVSGELILGIAAFPAFPTLIYQRVRGAPMRSLSVPVRSQLARATHDGPAEPKGPDPGEPAALPAGPASSQAASSPYHGLAAFIAPVCSFNRSPSNPRNP